MGELGSELAELRKLPIKVEQPKKGNAKETEIVEKTVGDVLNPQAAGGCVVGTVATKSEVAAVEAALKSETAKEVLKNVRFAFSAKAEVGSQFALYALKGERADNGALKPSLDGDVISDAKPDYDSQHGGRPVVSMTMKTDAARIWADVTGKTWASPSPSCSTAACIAHQLQARKSPVEVHRFLVASLPTTPVPSPSFSRAVRCQCLS